ncbi:MAG: HAMP domain-containing protein [Gammaproteobacteria bacterium]|nr:HAMP domain-containing protein [Gammaproteobacteria bacterium]
MTSLSIKSKLLIMLLGVSAASIAIVTTLNYLTSYEILKTNVFAQLTSVRASRADQVEQGFIRMRAETDALSNAYLVTEAAREFISAFKALANAKVDPSWDASLAEFYRQEFLPGLARTSMGSPELANYLPSTPVARVLQYHFIAANPYTRDTREHLAKADFDSVYGRHHATRHEALKRVAKSFNLYDLFLIDIETGDIVYTVRKETDFATNLIDGPYDASSLAELFRQVRRTPDRGAVRFIDFAHYRPSYNEPAAFFAAPVMVGDKAIAVLAVQTSIDRVNRVMTGGGHWERDGLGKTGETILIGPDYLLRSASRFLIEDPEGYARSLRSAAVPEQDIARILELGTPVLEQEARTVAAEEALHGRTGTGVIIDYRGVEILGSWAPLRITDLNWAIVGKVDLAEAYAPMRELARNTVIQTFVIMLVITLTVMFLASSFVRPVNDLIARVRRAGSGDVEVQLGTDSTDEIGDLSRSFHQLVESVRSQTRTLEVLTRDNQQLLENLMPKGLADRMRVSDDDISEVIDNVTVIFAEVRGLLELTSQLSGTESAALLKSIIAAFDDAAQRHGIEKITTVGDTYLAACGLSAPILDHAKRTAAFACDLKRIVARVNAERAIGVDIIVGIGTGPVVADAARRDRFVFHLWGDAVIQADHARDRAQRGQILVTPAVRDKLTDLYEFCALDTGAELQLWELNELDA